MKVYNLYMAARCISENHDIYVRALKHVHIKLDEDKTAYWLTIVCQRTDNSGKLFSFSSFKFIKYALDVFMIFLKSN